MIIQDCLKIKCGKYYMTLYDLYRHGIIIIPAGVIVKAADHFYSFEEWQFKDSRGKLFRDEIKYKDLSGKIRTLYKNETKLIQ